MNIIETTTHICKEHQLLMTETRVFDESGSMLDARLEVMSMPYVSTEISDELLKERYGIKVDVWDLNWERLSYATTTN